MKSYEPVIGLEVHIEPKLESKMFCKCPADHFAKEPNTQVCPVCLGLPGALPFANREGITAVVKMGLAVGSKINKTSRFYRKNYFYPDLPKSYQISQLGDPFCVGGSLLGKRINHIHLEEDAGKLQHETLDGEKVSLVDFNRSGVALIELVTEPDFSSVSDVIEFLKEVQLLARYLTVSDADMEKGSMRLEANISIKKVGEKQTPNYKVELKNINSFKFLEKAVRAEIDRQLALKKQGKEIIQETRGYDEVKKTTYSQRTKSGANDYRYFPEPDLPPVHLSDEGIKKIKSQIPELPEEKRNRFKSQYGISSEFVAILASQPERAGYFEEVLKEGKKEGLSPKMIADLIINKKLDQKFPEAAGLARYIVELTKVEYASEIEVEKAVKSVLMKNEKAIKDYRNGRESVVGFLIGMVQKELSGRGNPRSIQQSIIEALQKN